MILLNLPKIMIICLICTIIKECLVSFILRVKSKKDYLNIILVNILTNPLVVSISVLIQVTQGIKIKNISLIILEILAFITEGLIYHKYLDYKKINGFILSLILNISSYSIGLVINQLIW